MKRKLLILPMLLLGFGFSSVAQVTMSGLGSNNGCVDGQNTAYSSNYQEVHDSILSNPHISADYKAAYTTAFWRCRIEYLEANSQQMPDSNTVHNPVNNDGSMENQN